jgi:hypothetical protein
MGVKKNEISGKAERLKGWKMEGNWSHWERKYSEMAVPENKSKVED